MSTELQLIEREVFAMREPFMAALTDQSINFDAEAGYAVQILAGNDYALKIARSNPQSVRNAVTNVAAIGISLNPARKQAYLVPRDGKICLDISYMGLIEIAVDSGCIRWGQSRLVHKSDVFELNGIDQQPTHLCKPFDTERGELVGVYAVAKTREGDYLTEAMAISDVFAVRDRSSAWKAWVANKKRCPWVTDEGEMIRKTVIKRAYKYWPKSDRMDRAIDMLNTQNDEGLATDEIATQTVEQAAARSSSPGKVCADMAERGLTEERKHELDDCALTMIEKHQKGNDLAALKLYSDLDDNEEKLYIWRQIRSESALRSFIKANPPDKRAASEVVNAAVPTNIFEDK